MAWADQFDEKTTIGSLTKKIKKKAKYYYVCMSCGKTVDSVNKDKECKQCVKEVKNSRGSGYGQKYHYSDYKISDIF